jgi:hypothetical protein
MISMVLSALLAYATLRGVFTALDSWWRWISKEYLLDRKKKKEEEKGVVKARGEMGKGKARGIRKRWSRPGMGFGGKPRDAIKKARYESRRGRGRGRGRSK